MRMNKNVGASSFLSFPFLFLCPPALNIRWIQPSYRPTNSAELGAVITVTPKMISIKVLSTIVSEKTWSLAAYLLRFYVSFAVWATYLYTHDGVTQSIHTSQAGFVQRNKHVQRNNTVQTYTQELQIS